MAHIRPVTVVKAADETISDILAAVTSMMNAVFTFLLALADKINKGTTTV